VEYSPLTRREAEVVEMVANLGISPLTASVLNISYYTFQNHLRHVREKLDTSSTPHAVVIAWTNGWIK
jgi:DNA-binding CsgD family transcriptional regulator